MLDRALRTQLFVLALVLWRVHVRNSSLGNEILLAGCYSKGQVHDLLCQTQVSPPVLDLHRVLRPDYD